MKKYIASLLALATFCCTATSFAAPTDDIAPPSTPCIRQTAKLTFHDGKETRITVCEGQMGTVLFSDHKQGIGITPTRDTNNKNLLLLQISQITVDENNNQTFTSGARIWVADTGDAFYENGPISVKIQMLPQKKTDGAESASLRGGRCCVKCGNTTACGLEVTNDCGSCCADC